MHRKRRRIFALEDADGKEIAKGVLYDESKVQILWRADSSLLPNRAFCTTAKSGKKQTENGQEKLGKSFFESPPPPRLNAEKSSCNDLSG